MTAVSEPMVRLIAFLAIFGAMAAFELWSPRLERPELAGALKARRWATNLALVIVSSVLLRLVFPAAAVGAAVWAQAHGWGLLPALGVPPLLAGLVSFVVLDFAIWLEHLVFHKAPLFWRLHRVHHADTGFDVTTGLRFHPLEILASILWKAAIIVTLGAPYLAVLIFEIVLNGSSMFNHANVRLPLGLDRLLRQVIVTPDMHRIHHSVIRRETDSNYGFNFSFWDKLFGTYRAEPEAGQQAIEIGQPQWRDESPARLGWSLLLPFRRQ